MTWRHVHILFGTCFAYPSLSLIQIEGTGNGWCMVHIRWCQGETQCPILFGPQFWRRWRRGEHMCHRNTVTGKAHLLQTTFSFPTWYVTCCTWRVCYLKCLVVLLRVVRCELQHVCFPVSAGWENSCHPCDQWSWSRYIMDQNCNGILPVVYWSILG